MNLNEIATGTFVDSRWAVHLIITPRNLCKGLQRHNDDIRIFLGFLDLAQQRFNLQVSAVLRGIHHTLKQRVMHASHASWREQRKPTWRMQLGGTGSDKGSPA